MAESDVMIVMSRDAILAYEGLFLGLFYLGGGLKSAKP
jgi:hypothetical protein